jgi:hypothetical protein
VLVGFLPNAAAIAATFALVTPIRIGLEHGEPPPVVEPVDPPSPLEPVPDPLVEPPVEPVDPTDGPAAFEPVEPDVPRFRPVVEPSLPPGVWPSEDSGAFSPFPPEPPTAPLRREVDPQPAARSGRTRAADATFARDPNRLLELRRERVKDM